MRTPQLSNIVTAIVLAGGVIVAGVRAADDGTGPHGNPRSAKDIFYRLDTDNAAPSTLALNYKILLKRGNEVTQVPSDFAFKSGDSFRLVFQSNVEGYIYLLHRGSSGNGRFLFPDSRIDAGSNHVAAYGEQTVPAQGWFTFDENVGTEIVHMIVTEQPMPELLRLTAEPVIEPGRWGRVVNRLVAAYEQWTSDGLFKDIVYVDVGQSAVPMVQMQVNQTPAVELAGESSGTEDAPAAQVQADASVEETSTPTSTQPAETTADSVILAAAASPVPTATEVSPVPPAPAAEPLCNQTTQTYVAHAPLRNGQHNVLVHTVHLNHR